MRDPLWIILQCIGLVDIMVDLKVNHYYDPIDFEGLCLFTSELLAEGTENFTAAEFAVAMEETFRKAGMGVTPE